KRSGRNFFGLCPFHKEKSPSFSVSPDKQIFHCFGCGVGGNVIHFISQIENLDFKESLELLAERANITLPVLSFSGEDKNQVIKQKIYEINNKSAEFYHNSLYNKDSKIAQDYIKLRKLNNDTLKAFQIGYAGQNNELYAYLKGQGFSDEELLASSMVIKNESGKYVDRFRKRLMFPIQDVRNKTIAFGGRVLDSSLPKYINSPENAVYSKGRNLYGLNVAKNENASVLIIVEGYMDAVSLHQRGIKNVVASLGTALTEAQGRLLRKYSEKIVISYDSDAAGQAATLRGLEILKNMGCDVRVLQMEDAKDPDEYVVKFGSGRFNMLVNQAISLVEFKIKVLKSKLNIENTNDKIKFLNEIAKILSTEDNNIEQEVYIEKISKDYNISKEAIYAQINKNSSATNKGSKILEKTLPIHNKIKIKVSDEVSIKREKLVISFLLNGGLEVYEKIKNYIMPTDFTEENNILILKKLYEEFERGNSNINNILDTWKEPDKINYITGIMAEDFEITDIDRSIKDVIAIYKKEKLNQNKIDIIAKLENNKLSIEEKSLLEKELNEIIINLASIR
ncbi:MAG: DNA primase, partial [Lachnospiraceae bacterium]|nr:DNA primase [Lachnospiraceae bacterium]